MSRYFIEYFALDLLMTPDGECVGVIAVCMEVRWRFFVECTTEVFMVEHVWVEVLLPRAT